MVDYINGLYYLEYNLHISSITFIFSFVFFSMFSLNTLHEKTILPINIPFLIYLLYTVY